MPEIHSWWVLRAAEEATSFRLSQTQHIKNERKRGREEGKHRTTVIIVFLNIYLVKQTLN